MKNHLTRIFSKLYFPLMFLLLMGMDLGFRFLYADPSAHSVFYGKAFLFTVCWSLLMCGILALLPLLARRIATVILVLFWCFIFLVHGGMYTIFGSYFSFADLAYADDGAKFFNLSYLHYRKALICMIAAALFIAVLIAALLPKACFHWYRPVIGAAVIFLSAVGIWAVDSTLKEADNATFAWDTVYSANSDASLYSSFTDSIRCLHIAGNYQYLFRSLMVSTGMEDALTNGETYQQLDAYYSASPKANHESNAMTGAFAGKNLILVLLESIDTWLLTEDYMPNLYALQQGGINCADHYSPMFISAGTFGSEYTVNTGLLAPTNGVNPKAYSTYAFPYSLANLFEAAGYTANSFHSASPSIYSRGIIHQNWGYEAYHSYVEMGMDDYQLDSQMIRGYDQMVSDTPFFSFLLTYSGHGPYTEAMDNISAPHWEEVYAAVKLDELPASISEDDLQEYYRAVAHAMETDAFIGELVESLTADGHLEDTVLIFFADHYCKYMTNTELVMELKGAENSDLLCQTPFFIYSAGTEPLTITKPTSTMDITPTIANLFDLDVNYAYYPGNDIFGEDGGYVIFRNYNWYDGEIYYSADYDGEITEYIADRSKTVRTSVNMAWDTLRCNYFAHLESGNP